jgi:Holliday junction resolvase RusA-like endonuclease
MRIDIKPMSYNRAYRGRVYPSAEYLQYMHDVSYLLPPLKLPEGKLKLDITFGFSNKASDIDNGVKAFLDLLQKKYGFNDSRTLKKDLWQVFARRYKKGLEMTGHVLRAEEKDDGPAITSGRTLKLRKQAGGLSYCYFNEDRTVANAQCVSCTILKQIITEKIKKISYEYGLRFKVTEPLNSCRVLNSTSLKNEAHMEDYSKPLEVTEEKAS